MKAKKDITGQLVFDWSESAENYVVQGNGLLEGRQNLGLNAAKIIRAVIMQIKPEDDNFKTYVVSVPTLGNMLHVDRSDLYRDMDKISDEILHTAVAIRDGRNGTFIKYPWVTAFGYAPEIGLAVQMNPNLKPFLLGLKASYTQYQLVDILTMKSVYAIRIYELLMKEKGKRFKGVLPNNGMHIIMTVSDIRIACDCEEKYERISQFKAKVLDMAVTEINRVTSYKVSYEPVKEKGKTVSIDWHLNMKYH